MFTVIVLVVDSSLGPLRMPKDQAVLLASVASLVSLTIISLFLRLLAYLACVFFDVSVIQESMCFWFTVQFLPGLFASFFLRFSSFSFFSSCNICPVGAGDDDSWWAHCADEGKTTRFMSHTSHTV